jgi:ribonucleoside-triphosphate reductase
MNADTPAGMMMKFASETTKPFVDDYLLSEESRNAVEHNYLHIHDKDYYPTKSLTCVQHPLDNILQHGFTAGHGASRAAKRIETASVLACISMECAQNEMHGGQAIPAFDFYLAPYVRMSYIEELKALEELNGEDYKELYDEPLIDYLKAPLDGLQGKDRARQHAINKTVGRVHQAMEAFIHNMNTIHSRGGNQVVFSSINYGTDTSAEGRCVMREILLSTYEGVGNGETAIFPIQIWKKKRGVNYLPEDRNFDLYQLACKVTARRFFPNFLNLDATFNQDEEWKADDPKRYVHEVATMGCRTRVFENRFGPKTSIGRGNLSFSTINIVKLALECREEQDKQKRIDMFFAKLDQMLEITAKQLDDRFHFQKTAFAKQFPLLMQNLWIGADKLKPMDTIESVINQGTLGIGFIGLAECLVALVGKHHGESEEAQELGLKIVGYMRDRVNEFCDRYHHNYSVLATPAEGLSGKFTKKDRKEFGVIPGVTDRDYYTNSNHVPVYYKCSARHKAEIEAPYHEMTRGGHIFYVEIDGDATHNPQVIMSVVDMMDQLNMGYGSVNHNRNRCMDCGYENADDHLEKCPKCGSTNIDKLQRITGYLVGTTDRWNSGKLAELNDRVTHIDHGAKDLFED